MPLYRIYSATGVYTFAEKHALANAIKDMVTPLLPAFYVGVFFIDVDKDSFFIGGEPNDTFVRFNVQHLARHIENKEGKTAFMHKLEGVIKPFTADKGVNWEINVDEADHLMWHENGMSPPAPGSEGDELWKKKNKAVPFEGPTFASAWPLPKV